MTLSTQLDDRAHDFGYLECGCRLSECGCDRCGDERECEHGVSWDERCAKCDRDEELDALGDEVREDEWRDQEADEREWMAAE